MRRIVFACLWAGLALPAYALGLGDVQGRAVIGRPLALEIPIVGSENLAEHARCLRLIPEGDDADLVNISLRVDRRKLFLTTTRAITQPVFRFRIRVGCPAILEESYVVLADPPESSVNQLAPIREVPRRVQATSNIGGTSVDRFTVSAPTTLRLLSRQRYPGNSSERVRYIKKMAAANPELFSSEAGAYDQPLPMGTELRVPDGLPKVARLSDKTVSPPVAAPVLAQREPGTGKSTSAEAKGKGRLVISGNAAPAGRGPSTQELSDALDRLTEAMTEQVKVESATIERLKALEGQFLEIKRQAAAEREAMARLEAELKLMREQAERDSFTKLVLFIMLGGLFAAFVLRWVMDRRSRQHWIAQDVVANTAPAGKEFSAATQKVRPLRPKTVEPKRPEDDLEDILPPPK